MCLFRPRALRQTSDTSKGDKLQQAIGSAEGRFLQDFALAADASAQGLQDGRLGGQDAQGSSTACVREKCAPLAAALLVVAIGVMSIAGCNENRSESGAPTMPEAISNQQQSEALFDYAIGLLEDLDQYNDFNNQQALEQIVGRLNQWIQLQNVDQHWEADPLVKTLPEAFQRLTVVRRLADLHFSQPDGTLLREAIWLRDVARMAQGEAVSELEKAVALFDWTVRNIQLDAPPEAEAAKSPNLPWHTLLFGHGLAEDRAWVFILLARQLGIDAVMLALPNPQAPKGYRPWAVGVLSQGELYLFDPELGLPLPQAGGTGVATLGQLAADDSLLRQLDLEEHAYPVRADDLSELIALIEASPGYLSRRMQIVESHLAGDRYVTLSVEASKLAQRVARCQGVGQARLWLLPYERIAEQMHMTPEQTRITMLEALPFQVAGATLWKARILHLMGHLTGKNGANTLYMASRPSEVEMAEADLKPAQREVLKRRKQAASYWLGLIAMERGRYETAIQHFERRTLKDWPDSPWTAGARFNLARSLEALGQLERAAKIYAADTSPQWHGNHLRARWLRAKLEQQAATD